MNRIKPIKFYFVLALMLVGYYAYSAWNGIGFWENKVIKDTDYNGSRGGHVRGVHGFYHK